MKDYPSLRLVPLDYAMEGKMRVAVANEAAKAAAEAMNGEILGKWDRDEFLIDGSKFRVRTYWVKVPA